ncbi:MAG: hypothetical protein RL539_494, partial [Pseudomonadota bacterium]
RAATGTKIAHDHEGCRAFAKTLANIRAGGLFTNRVQTFVAQDAFDLVKTRMGRGCLHADPFGLGQCRSRVVMDLDRDPRGFCVTLLLSAGIFCVIAHGVYLILLLMLTLQP